MFTKKLFWVLVIGFLNLVSVDAKERSKVCVIARKGGNFDYPDLQQKSSEMIAIVSHCISK